MEKRNVTIAGIAALLIVSILAFGCTDPSNPVDRPGDGNTTQEYKEIPRLQSYAELEAAFSDAQKRAYGINGGIVMEDLVMATGAPAPMMARSEQAATGGAADGAGATDYSTTNVQVEGVDEADIIKTDGKYIYTFSQNRLVIAEAFPVQDAKVLAEQEIEGIYPREMFVNGDQLVLFGNTGYDRVYFRSIAVPEPYDYRPPKAVVLVYDISDKANPKIAHRLGFEGNYVNSRMIGDHVYFVVNAYPRYYAYGEDGIDLNADVLPKMSVDGVEKSIATVTDIGYIPPMPARSFVTIAALDLSSMALEKETILGSGDQVYASLDNLYLTSTVWLPPETPVVSDVPGVKEVERTIVGDSEKTAVHKFALDNGHIRYVGNGSVPGHVLNQFSMDEHDGHFRVATTRGRTTRSGGQATNNVYVLDSELDIVGALEGLAPGESIFSARFMGERAYLVTFRKVDPLFVLDLSEPTDPKVLGKLKIPGFSDYLHPFDETHIIGVGKDTVASEYDFAWYQGMKLAIFDVSDVENPVEMHKLIIGDRGTDSYALHDHKAFLFDRQRELLVLPITLHEIPEDQKTYPNEETDGTGTASKRIATPYGEPTFQGAFVYRVNLDEGFVERGRITHITAEDEQKRGYYFDDAYSVKRALYLDDVLYTYSERGLLASHLDTLETLAKLPFTQYEEPQRVDVVAWDEPSTGTVTTTDSMPPKEDPLPDDPNYGVGIEDPPTEPPQEEPLPDDPNYGVGIEDPPGSE